jgi:tryptophanyl-tRNA synthetase
MKKQLAEDMVQFISPIRQRAEEIRKDENTLKRIMNQGAERARESARQTIEATRKLVGLNYFE